jgi:hypothetical protein
MLKHLKYLTVIVTIVFSLGFFSSCNKFLNPEQDLNITQDQLYKDWYEYRSIAMGLYGLQQKLVEQLVILGELRGDLLTVTPNADADMVEIYNFEVSKNNKYADPTNFYKLISACNSLIRQLKEKHPEVVDKNAPVTNYDKLYGEALCMRAWAYFNVVRIYGKVPVIWESLTSIGEIENYLNSTTTYIDSVNIVFGPDGYHNDTTYNKPITLQKQYYDLNTVDMVFSKQLEDEVKAVGVNHYIDNNDKTWEVTVWNTWAWHALLGQMYLEEGDYTQAAKHFNAIAFMTSDNYRYQLDASFSNGNWRNIFPNIDNREHILTLWFNKTNQQQNQFQNFFEPFGPHKYMMKPTKAAIDLWETNWRGYSMIVNDAKPWLTKLNPQRRGFPADYYRGYGTSYLYVKNGQPLAATDFLQMLQYKMDNDLRSVNTIMDGVDTIVYKYSINKDTYDEDANYIIYRAGGIQLYLAEIYTWWAFERNGIVSTFTTNAVNIVNDGSNYDVSASRLQMGIRGRVGYNTGPYDGVQVGNINYIHNPYTNEVTGYTDLTGNLQAKQLYLEELILDERGRELAYEGERFNDLVRMAKRRNDPSFLAKRVSAKYPAGMRQRMYNKLLDQKNWYINMFNP